MNYWENKEQNAAAAKNHIKEMEDKFTEGIRYSSENTIQYTEEFRLNSDNSSGNISITIEPLDSVSAIMKYGGNSKTAILNFASYKEAGGKFLEGSSAQEESLCHNSFLYNVLSKFNRYYSWNNSHLNRGLYTNRALYSPDIIFFKNDKEVKCNVITCAAPNFSVAQRFNSVSKVENSKALISRIRFVLDIAKDNKIETLILGAYGCGVFKQDSYEVASIFKVLLLSHYRDCFKKVIFAIPNGTNFLNFKLAFSKVEE